MLRFWTATKRQLLTHACHIAVLVFLSIGLEVVMHAAQDDVQARNKQAVAAAFEAWRNGTGSVFDLLTPDASWTIVGNSPVSRTFTNRQHFLDNVIGPFNARLSTPLVPTVRGIFADGDMVIALFDGEATARDGRPYRNTYTWYMQMREGRIVDVVAFFDTIEFTDLWKRLQPVP
jgi:ketosteroid isomerase-like protein